jgi:hypothetical protein
MKHHIVTAVLMLVAIALYYFGLNGFSLLAFALGAVFELWFWVRIAQHFRAKTALTHGPK